MSSFQERQTSLFNHLKDAEEQYSFSKSNNAAEQKDYNVIDQKNYRKIRYQMKQFRGKESIFKRPEANIRKCLRAKTTPDYLKNPQNWTYYSLADVTEEQMSDATNTATALALMQELENKDSANKTISNHEVYIDETGAIFKKPMFQASKTLKASKILHDKSVVYKKDKVVMPEYVVGVSRKKEKKKPLLKKENTEMVNIKLKLIHLYEDDPES